MVWRVFREPELGEYIRWVSINKTLAVQLRFGKIVSPARVCRGHLLSPTFLQPRRSTAPSRIKIAPGWRAFKESGQGGDTFAGYQ